MAEEGILELTAEQKLALKAKVEEFERAANDIGRFADLMQEAHGPQIAVIAFVAVTATLISTAPSDAQASLVGTILKHLEDTREQKAKAAAEEALKSTASVEVK